jgi:hypothetical protein
MSFKMFNIIFDINLQIMESSNGNNFVKVYFTL